MSAPPVLGRAWHRCALVADFDAALGTATLGSTSVYGSERELARRRYRETDGTFKMLLAVSDGEPQIELVQPLAGPSIYEVWLTEHGEGLHRVSLLVEGDSDARYRLVTPATR